jgi:hypothetical protein
MLRTPWQSGPFQPTGQLVLVSVTRLKSERRVDLPGIYRRGLSLLRRWPRLDGAVGIWLWSEPLAGLSGSISVWRDEAALHAFLGLPEHVAVMRDYADRGSVSATVFSSPWPARRETLTQATNWLHAA